MHLVLLSIEPDKTGIHIHTSFLYLLLFSYDQTVITMDRKGAVCREEYAPLWRLEMSMEKTKYFTVGKVTQNYK